MSVLVVGATGGTGRLLVRELLERGRSVTALVRDPARGQPLQELGARIRVADLEGDLDGAVTGVDAVVFCAGSGSSTGPDATLRVDLHGALRIIDACVQEGVRRYVQLSSMAADDPLQGPPAIRHYLAAMHARDRLLVASGLDATIVRPGGLTDEPGTGRVRTGVPTLGERGSIPRADVAAVLAACLEEPGTIGATFELVAGDVPIAEAVAEVVRSARSG
ncbi:MAG: SDR family oxidoreductase [Nitriliruptoraceae bacterium]